MALRKSPEEKAQQQAAKEQRRRERAERRRLAEIEWAKRALIFVGAILAAAIVGCGSGSEANTPKEAVLDVVSAYQAGLLDGDPNAMCDQLTGEAARGFVVSLDLLDEAEDCSAALGRVIELVGDDELALLTDAQSRLDDALVRISGSNAVVNVANGATLKLEKVADRWYIADPDAEDFTILPTGKEVKRCLEKGGAFGVQITDVADGPSNAPLVLGIGPSGGRMGILLSDNPRISRSVSSEFAGEFEIEVVADERAVIISEQGGEEDVALAEDCLSGNARPSQVSSLPELPEE